MSVYKGAPMQTSSRPPSGRVLITWTDSELFSAIAERVSDDQLLLRTQDGRSFLIPASIVLPEGGRPLAQFSEPLLFDDPAWWSASGSVTNFSSRQNVTIMGSRLEMYP